jgi:hypothetical protein
MRCIVFETHNQSSSGVRAFYGIKPEDPDRAVAASRLIVWFKTTKSLEDRGNHLLFPSCLPADKFIAHRNSP